LYFAWPIVGEKPSPRPFGLEAATLTAAAARTTGVWAERWGKVGSGVLD